MKEPQMDLTGAKILAVDDVPANLDVLSQALEADGYNVLVATSGEMALDVVSRIAPDLILLDVMMPGMNGFETCRRLKAHADTQNIPVIFLTARNELEGILEGFQAGGVDYISKPFQKEEVLIRLRTHLERFWLARDLAELNAHLEQKVAERTLQLQQKVKELEGRDRIAQHLLTYHTLEETLSLVLEVIVTVTDVDRIAIYLFQEQSLQPVVGMGFSAPGVMVLGSELAQIPLRHSRQEAFSDVQKSRKSICVATADHAEESFALVPILRGNELLGLIEADQAYGRNPISEETVQALNSFAVQAAVAIVDAKVQTDASRWKEQLDDVLNLDTVLKEVTDLDNLPDERHKE